VARARVVVSLPRRQRRGREAGIRSEGGCSKSEEV